MYGSTKDKHKLENAQKSLEYLYKKIPDTKGCMEYISKPASKGGCGAWCCKLQNPQVLYSEFLLTWNHITHNWSDEKIGELIRRSLENYMQDSYVKGCVFWSRETKLCGQHETRPFNCRIYGITPEEEWKPRYERLKVIYPDTKPQCGLVSTTDGSEFTKKKSDAIWREVKQVEQMIGIRPELITDDFGGSYRTYHDHILLHIFGESGLEFLTEVNLNSSDEEKAGHIEHLMNAYWSYQKDLREHGREDQQPESEDSES